jgi:hypothetical protein
MTKGPTEELKNEQLELAILNDVVNRFVHPNQSTARRAILIKYKNQPAAKVLQNLLSQNIIRRKTAEATTTNEEYIPAAAAFELCGDTKLLEEAKHASAVVLYTLQQMFVGEAAFPLPRCLIAPNVCHHCPGYWIRIDISYPCMAKP